MSKRSVWCEFDKATRKYIKKRDGERCIICGEKGALQIMHIFLSRSQGGRGCKENGGCGCVKCHRIIDNPIGNTEMIKSREYMAKAKSYLIEKEHIIVNKDFIDSLKYKKQLGEMKPEAPKIIENRCSDCQRIVKNKYNNSSIPSYYCPYKKAIIGKKNEACAEFRKKVD